MARLEKNHTSGQVAQNHLHDLHDLLVQELAVQSAAQEAQPSSSPSALPSGPSCGCASPEPKPSAVPPMLGCELCMLRCCVCPDVC